MPDYSDWNAVRWHMVCGIEHSGIPICCVAFYLSDYDPDDEGYKAQWTYGEAQYVPCPACIERRSFVTLRECDCLRIPAFKRGLPDFFNDKELL